jgi:hypothetical protein
VSVIFRGLRAGVRWLGIDGVKEYCGQEKGGYKRGASRRIIRLGG